MVFGYVWFRLAPVAQLDRALASGAKGCGFDPRRAQFRGSEKWQRGEETKSSSKPLFFLSLRSKSSQLRLDLAQCAFLRRERRGLLFRQRFRRCAGTGQDLFQFGGMADKRF